VITRSRPPPPLPLPSLAEWRSPDAGNVVARGTDAGMKYDASIRFSRRPIDRREPVRPREGLKVEETVVRERDRGQGARSENKKIRIKERRGCALA